MKTTASRASAVSQTRGFGDLLYDKAGSRPSLDLDFAGTSSLRDKITGENLVDHTRASNGTYIDSEGLVKEAQINYITNHKTLTSTGASSETIVNPEGVEESLGVLSQITSVPTKNYRFLGHSFSLGGDTTYAFSIYMRTDQGTAPIQIDANDNGAGNAVQVVTVTDQWQRFSVVETSIASNPYRFADLHWSDGTQSNHTYNTWGGGASKIYFWGAQLEKHEVTDLMKTTGTINSAPRFTHERVETGNLLLNSQNLHYWEVAINSFIVGRTLAPDNTYSATVFGSDGSGSNVNIRPKKADGSIGIVLKPNTTYTYSIYAKLESGSAPTSGNILPTLYGQGVVPFNGNLTTEWKRFSTTFTTGTSSLTQSFYTGTDPNTTAQIAYWGAQLEENDGASTYVPSIDTFTSRASSATYVDSAGLVKKAALNYILNSDAPSHHSHTTQGIHTTLSYPSTTQITDGPFGTNQIVKKAVVKDDKPDFVPSGSGDNLISDQKIRIGADSGGGGIGGGLANQTFTWSFYYRSLSGDRRISTTTGTGSNKGTVQLTATSEWQRAVVTGARSDTLNILDIHYLFNGGADLEFASFQVEKGSRASDYVANPFTSSNMPAGTNTSAEARYSHDPETLTPTGLYLEPQGVNYAKTYSSQEFTYSDVIAPDGSNTIFDSNSTNLTRYITAGTNQYTPVNGQTVTVSYWAKYRDSARSSHTGSGRNKVRFLVRKWGSSTAASINFMYDITTQTMVSSQTTADTTTTFKPYPNGWYRVSHTFVTDSAFTGDTNMLFYQYQGGASAIHADLPYVWGFQYEVGSYATAYIPNAVDSTASVTRAADVYTSTANLTETFEPRGLLIEEARTNNLLHSADITGHFQVYSTPSNSQPWMIHSSSNSFVAAGDTTTAPDGSTVPWYNLKEFIYQDGAVTGAGTFTNSVYLKAETPCTVHLRQTNNANSNAACNLTTEWQRFTTTGTKTSNGGPVYTRLLIDNRQNTTATTVKIAIWGAQQEVASFPTSYIYTDASTVTRSADIASISGDNFGTYRTNLLTHSNFPSQSLPTSDGIERMIIKPYFGLSPSNKYDSTKFIPNTESSSLAKRIKWVGYASGSQTTKTLSFYAKAGGLNFIHGRLNTTGVCFNLSNGTTSIGFRDGTVQGTAAVSSSMEDVGNGWYRCIMTSNVATNISMLYPSTSSTTTHFTSNGIDGIELYGVQTEEGTLTNYISSTDTFTSRLGNAKYVDSNGLIKTAYRNYIKYTNSIGTNATWNNGELQSLTLNNATAPDGTQTASLIIPNTNNANNHFTYQGTAGLNGALSVHVKSAGMSHFSLIGQHNSNNSLAVGVSFDIINGTIHTSHNATGEIIDVGNGWYRVIVKPTIAENSRYFVCQPHTGGTPQTSYRFRTTYAGNGTDGVYLWGAMMTDNPNDAGEYTTNLGTTQSGAPRYSHDPETLVPTGLYLEPSATNLIPTHNGSSHLIVVTETTNDAIAPDGTATATKISEAVGNENSIRYVQHALGNGTMPANSTVSVFLKAGTLRYVGVIAHASTQASWEMFVIDLQEGVITQTNNLYPTYKLEKYPNGWYRFSYLQTSQSNGNVLLSGFRNPTRISTEPYNININRFVGDTSKNFYYWGWQVEAGTFPSSPILTSGSTATRPADTYTSTATTVFDRDGGNKEAWYNNFGARSIYVDVETALADWSRVFYMIGANGAHKTCFFRNNNFTNPILEMNYVTSAGTQYSPMVYPGVRQFHKVALGADTNDAKFLSATSSHVGSDSSVTFPTGIDSKQPSSMILGNTNSYTSALNSGLRRLTFWKTRLPDSSLINTTT